MKSICQKLENSKLLMTLLINFQINLLFKRKFPTGLTSKLGNLVWPNARAALVLSVSPMFYTGFKSLNSIDGLCLTLNHKDKPSLYGPISHLKFLRLLPKPNLLLSYNF
jgi:hypothetical protein